MRWILAMLLCLGPVSAQEMRAPTLGVASNFGQGVPRGLLQAATNLGIDDFRDAVYWDRVEGADGRFRYGPLRDSYPDQLAARGAGMSLTVNNGHRLYEGGATPLGPEAVAAFGRHAAETVARFPNIDGVEVGNEFNSANFVSGPLREAGLAARAEAYVALFDSVARQVRARRPEVRIIGGGVHSIPTGYLARLGEAGLFARMDAIALHPYDTPIEVLDRQIAVMRTLPGLEDMPVEITEFGTQNPAEAPGLLLKWMCKAAQSGVSRLVWYALHPRGDDYAPLLLRDGDITDFGRAFIRVRDQLAGQPVRDISPDALTPACLFGDRHVVIWGMPRAITVGADLMVRDPLGAVLRGPLRLSEAEPMVIEADRPIEPEADIKIAPQDVLFDTFFQFSYPSEDQAQTDDLIRLARSPNGEAPLITRPGQDRAGVPWTPYLGLATNPNLRLLSRSLLPSGGADFPEEIVHRYTAPTAMTADLYLRLAPAARSADGVTLTVTLDGVSVLEDVVTSALDRRLSALTLDQGSVLDIAVGPNSSARGDVTDYRFTLRQAD